MSCNHVIPPLLLSVLLSLSARAGMVVYTDHVHPPSGVTGDTRVVWLDAPEQLQQSLFGTLTSDPGEAERRAQAVLHSAGWQQKQTELAQALPGQPKPAVSVPLLLTNCTISDTGDCPVVRY
ncbi:DUF1525 domain-containing protein [Salmonella enterica]|uniref:DUF1525 domain-containing protein n=1 Tax=Salmonella enterica TaxID=28901 RepID=UPI0021B48A22|nr:DUF1525 domain-containing protein [Salmonella enterica]MCT7173550.1 DUF1525 domain-containing protein [Salmonella enterica subsp. enterica serovar Anatum]